MQVINYFQGDTWQNVGIKYRIMETEIDISRALFDTTAKQNYCLVFLQIVKITKMF
jgi:hypothetical protein